MVGEFSTVSPHALRSVDQFRNIVETEQGLVAIFELAATVIGHCPGPCERTYALDRDQLDAKIAAADCLRPEYRDAQREQYDRARQKLQM